MLLPDIEDAAGLYPHRFFEKVNVLFSAGERERRFFGTVRCLEGISSFLGFDLQPGDTLEDWQSGVGLSYSVSVPAGGTRRIGFTPFPPDASYSVSIHANGGLIPPDRVFAGPYTLAYPGNPAKLGGLRDLLLLTSDEPPQIDPAQDFGAFIWYSPSVTKAQTKIGGLVKDALKAWGYVK